MTTRLGPIARRNTPVFYSAYQGLVSKLLNRPWSSSDGMDPAALQEHVQQSVAAQQLKDVGTEPTVAHLAPLSPQELYSALGVSEVMETTQFFSAPPELQTRDNLVMM